MDRWLPETSAGGRAWVWLQRENMRESCGDSPVECVDGGVGHTKCTDMIKLHKTTCITYEI